MASINAMFVLITEGREDEGKASSLCYLFSHRDPSCWKEWVTGEGAGRKGDDIQTLCLLRLCQSGRGNLLLGTFRCWRLSAGKSPSPPAAV